MTDVKHDIDALAGERWFPLETTITEDMSSIWGDCVSAYRCMASLVCGLSPH